MIHRIGLTIQLAFPVGPVESVPSPAPGVGAQPVIRDTLGLGFGDA
jgi:hypothetical protein